MSRLAPHLPRFVQPSPVPPAAAPIDPSAAELKDKMVRNEALLNRLIAQSTAQNEKSSVLDDMGIVEGVAAQRARKPPPRRAVTWVNEIRCGRGGSTCGRYGPARPAPARSHMGERDQVREGGQYMWTVRARKPPPRRAVTWFDEIRAAVHGRCAVVRTPSPIMRDKDCARPRPSGCDLLACNPINPTL